MASFQSPSLSASKGFPPLFVKASTLPSPSGGFINGLDICYALENVSGKDTVDCVQRIGDLFRIYTKNLSAREDLLIKGFSFNNISIPLLSHNPFQVKDQVVNTTKLVIGGVPMSVADSEIERALLDLGLNLLSELKYETYRDNNGKWTHFKTGRRFVYIELPKLNLDQFLKEDFGKRHCITDSKYGQRKSTNRTTRRCDWLRQCLHRRPKRRRHPMRREFPPPRPPRLKQTMGITGQSQVSRLTLIVPLFQTMFCGMRPTVKGSPQPSKYQRKQPMTAAIGKVDLPLATTIDRETCVTTGTSRRVALLRQKGR